MYVILVEALLFMVETQSSDNFSLGMSQAKDWLFLILLSSTCAM